jgi:molybdopterin synthase sulfur carrier subunit
VPVVWIPALLRELTGGVEAVPVRASTVREAIEALDQKYPGVKARLLMDDRLRPGISVIVDGTVSGQKLRHPLDENSEVHFLPAISGGNQK